MGIFFQHIKLKYLVIISLLMTFAAGLFWTIWVPQTVADMVQAKTVDLERQMALLGESIKPFIIGKQIAGIHDTLNILLNNYPDWLRIELSRPEGRVLYPIRPSPIETNINIISKTIFIYQGETHLANLTVAQDLNIEVAKVKTTQLYAGLFAGLFLVTVLITLAVLFSLIEKSNIKLRHLVELDELTGIYSRRGMKHHFGSDERSEDFGLYLIDLDHFKLVNDAYGHDAGDMLLKATANVLESQTRSEGSCFRLGGEEFALLRPWRGWKDAYDFSENLRELIGATSIESGGRSVQRTASIGVSYLSQNGSMSEALKLADIVLREAKERGRNSCVLADEETLADFEARGVFIQASEVQLALERGEMEYFVQPIVGGADNSTIGFEALIRWFLPSGELVGPMKFVDVLYQVIRQPRYAQLQLDLRRQVLEQLKDYPEQYVSFNFTLEQIGYLGGAKDLHREIQSILDHPNRQIVIELSEKALHARVNEDVLIDELSQLRAFGYKIALDDFGVESSNIQRLQKYPIDIVKIDRSLISEVTTSETTRRMVGSLAALLKSLELSVTVEGTETPEQAKIINDFGLTTHQGYYYSKPVPPAELLPRVAE